jgi:peroxiredoxin
MSIWKSKEFAMAKRAMLLGALAVLALCAGLWLTHAETPPANLGKKAPPFSLTDPRDQARFALDDCKDRKAVVVVFLGTECPINNRYLPTLRELHGDYAAKGVQFVGLNANCTDTAQDVAAHARKHEVPFPVLKDEGNKVADQFGARRTPEAFVIDAAGVIRYQGRIDDRYGIGYQRPQPTRRDLASALDEILAGKAVSTPTTSVAGCLIARVTAPKADGTITFTKHVARILQKNCQECHRPGQIGPMPLLSYEDAAGWSAMIQEVVQERRMPPWYADPKFGKFSNDRRLKKEDYDTLLAWIAAGCPKGDPKDMPPPRSWPEGWQIGKPDLILRMPEPYAVPAESPKGGIPYQHFFIDPGFTEDRWVVRAEARAGAPEVVHHVIVFILPAGKRFNQNDPTNEVLCGTAPGDMPLLLADGMAKRIPAGAKLVIQLHYTPNGKAQKDESYIGLIFTPKPPKYVVRAIPIANPLFRIPPGADNHKVEATYALRRDAQVIAFMPHMHLRGKDFLYEAIYPDGKTEVLLSVPHYNFNWQSAYRLAEPKPLPKGTRIHCVAHFDNSAKNPNNPDPTKAVFWGDQTWEEMMIGWIDLAFEWQP